MRQIRQRTEVLRVFVFIILPTTLLCDSRLKINYTGLAGEAERNKHDLLTFLNQTQIKDQYKALYNHLLDYLVNTKPEEALNDNRRIYGDATRRIVGGHNTSITAVPWQVSLRERFFPICGASVLTDVWLITAAHCLLKVQTKDLTVRLGSSWKTHGGEIYDVKEIQVHPKYSKKTKQHDVGLIKLYTQLHFSDKVLPISLVEREADLGAHQQAIVSGWGRLKENGAAATYLQSTTMSTIVMKLCRQSSLDRESIDPSTMFCAGSFNQGSPDACQGDSGGPIVSAGTLVGVVSWGLGCARGNFPGVYSRLSHPLIWDFIHENLVDN